MLPLVFPAIATTAVKAIVGTSPVRIYRHGQAPESAVRPYITWFVVTGTPQDSLTTPCADIDTVQIDCWSDDDTQVETLASAVRDALDAALTTNTVILNTFESETKLYRIGLQADFIKSR
ncbi:MAG: DUF3168 domain-containing protein [Pusillimonas sp.]|nr:DUF3168 domain-containing protein [Pusillimonas sp.]